MIKAVNYILNNDAPLSALVGRNLADTKTKVYPVIAPNPELAPYIVTSVQGTEVMTKGCADKLTIQVVSYAKGYDEVVDISAAARTALTEQQAGTINGYVFSFVNFINEVDGPYDINNSLYTRISIFEGY